MAKAKEKTYSFNSNIGIINSENNGDTVSAEQHKSRANHLTDKSKNGYRYCPLCGHRIVKNGKGKGKDHRQRWLCKGCGKSMDLHDDRQEQEQLILMCLDWILTKKTALQACEKYKISRSTFARKKKEFFKIIPGFVSTGEVYTCVLVDGNSSKGVTYLIAKTPKFVISCIMAEGETVETYKLLFSCFPPPEVVVCDGHKSIIAALKAIKSSSSVQRCFVHLNRYVKNRVGKNPKTPERRKILSLTTRLFKLEYDSKGNELPWEKVKENAGKWESEFWDYYNGHKHVIEAKHPLITAVSKKYEYDDRNLHRAWKHIREAIEKKQLWVYLDYPKGEVPRDTNGLEGGVNSNLKQQRYVHRGMPKEREAAVFKWDLIRKSEFGINDFLRNLKISKTPRNTAQSPAVSTPNDT